MLKIGLTGGIGSGKTTVAQVFEKLGVPVFYSDQEAKKCMQFNVALKEKIQSVFGKHLYEEGVFQKEQLASIVFNDVEALQMLNNLVHPVVKKVFENWCLDQDFFYVIKEAAILFETNSHKGLKHVICVSAPDELRLIRVMKRDGVSESQVRARMSKQWQQSKKTALADFQLNNNEERLLVPQILAIHQQLLNDAI